MILAMLTLADALACPSCGAQDSAAYLVSTIALSLIPVGMLGGTALVLYRRYQEVG